MRFMVTGRGIYSKEILIEKLTEWGVKNPLLVVNEAEKGRVICGQNKDIKILAIR